LPLSVRIDRAGKSSCASASASSLLCSSARLSCKANSSSACSCCCKRLASSSARLSRIASAISGSMSASSVGVAIATLRSTKGIWAYARSSSSLASLPNSPVPNLPARCSACLASCALSLSSSSCSLAMKPLILPLPTLANRSLATLVPRSALLSRRLCDLY
ncbi:hypothetical protein KCU83_g303, partial [Aureobasidium melanogenum]